MKYPVEDLLIFCRQERIKRTDLLLPILRSNTSDDSKLFEMIRLAEEVKRIDTLAEVLGKYKDTIREPLEEKKEEQ